jgi:hypothetical protein
MKCVKSNLDKNGDVWLGREYYEKLSIEELVGHALDAFPDDYGSVMTMIHERDPEKACEVAKKVLSKSDKEAREYIISFCCVDTDEEFMQDFLDKNIDNMESELYHEYF